ncbi:hypothetical protein MN608_11866 [Microdochium nivale]|nr:hypothetical protein MN608_11866 [Microdochium nivale]
MEGLTTDHFGEPRPWANHKNILLGMPITFLSIAWICVVNRLYIRFFIVKSPGWDDLFVVLYASMTTAGTAAIGHSVFHGFGEHYLTLSPEDMRHFGIDFFVANASYTSATTFIKLALLLQYLRVFERGTRIYSFCIWTAVVTALWGLAFSILAWVPCWPVSDWWDIYSTNMCFGFGSKIPTDVLNTYLAHTTTNMILDVVILAIPCTLFFGPDASRAQRTRLLVLLIMGSWILVFASWRLVEIVHNKAATYPAFDPTWYAPVSVLLAVLEIDCAAICASMPIFWPQIAKHWGGIVVVHEVKVTRETRHFDAEADDDDGGDERGLTRGGSRSGGPGGGGRYLQRLGSRGSDPAFKDAEVGGVDGEGNKSGATARYHGESYVMKQVERFKKDGGKPSAEVSSRPSLSGSRDNGRW